MNFEEAIHRLQAAKGDPEKLNLATIDVVLVSRDPALRIALEAAAVPHWFDAKILGALLGADEATARRLVEELRKLPMVESFAARSGWNVHEASRLALRNQLASEDNPRLLTLSARAVGCFLSPGSGGVGTRSTELVSRSAP